MNKLELKQMIKECYKYILKEENAPTYIFSFNISDDMIDFTIPKSIQNDPKVKRTINEFSKWYTPTEFTDYDDFDELEVEGKFDEVLDAIKIALLPKVKQILGNDVILKNFYDIVGEIQIRGTGQPNDTQISAMYRLLNGAEGIEFEQK
ncbi:MAG: hypothetical protein M0R17_10550 [Candidatus Omnitrophica bacterium]|jgi:hypothetical protein|nr:hypothetical protein [Candidatus Omnitrophota bacterium]